MLVEGFKLLEKYSITVPRYIVNRLPSKNELKYPIVIKADVGHKTDKGAIKLGISNYEELLMYYHDFKNKFKNSDIIIQEQITDPYIEVIIGIKSDPVFDYIVLFGIGGVYTEIFRDFIILVPEFFKEDFFNQIKYLKLKEILLGYRNLPKADLDKIFDIIKRLEKLYIKENLEEIEINPLLISEKFAYAVDIRFSRNLNSL